MDLREELAILAEEARTGVDPVALAAWGEAQPLLVPGFAQIATWALTALGLLGVAAFLVSEAGRLELLRISGPATAWLRDFFLVSLLINGTFLYRFRKRTAPVVAAVDEAAHELKLLSQTLVRLEHETFHSPCSPRSASL